MESNLRILTFNFRNHVEPVDYKENILAYIKSVNNKCMLY